jgi:hypothetical protein
VKVEGVKATGFSRGTRRQSPEIEMVSGCETVSRRPVTGFEYTVSLSADIGTIRLTLNEAEMRDWHMRLSRSLTHIDESR